jgi:hypothetical protein
MDNINLYRSKTSKKIIQNKIPKYNVDKRKSDGIAENVFLNKIKAIHNNKLNKIPVNHRLSIQDSNMFAFSKLINNLKPDTNEKPKKRDKDYYLNLLNNIYLNDSHLSSNKNVIKNSFKRRESNAIKKYEKKISMNTPKIMNYQNNFKIVIPNSDKKLDIISQNPNCEPNNQMNNLDNCIKDGISSKKENNISNEAKNSKLTKRYFSQKTVSKFKAKNGLKIKKKENKITNKEEKEIYDKIKERKISENNKEIKINENFDQTNNNKKESKNNDKEETELDIDNNKNPPNNKIVNNKSNKKHNESCFFCCCTVKDDDSFIN